MSALPAALATALVAAKRLELFGIDRRLHNAVKSLKGKKVRSSELQKVPLDIGNLGGYITQGEERE